jgi:catechol 2,3-dioxygenase-like lactoylglutathione lyase family enzyme
VKATINLITILTDDVPRLVAFYRDVLGMEAGQDQGPYVEFRHPGVRFAICARSLLEGMGLPQYAERPQGQRSELAFPVASPEEVDLAYEEIVAKGATPILPPQDMPWGQRTALFADPDGNIHELFADRP